MLLKLAWRNVWRNKRRTLITASSIFFAVVFSSFMIAIQNGGWGRMIDNVINYYVGYGQIHVKGYYEEPNINSLFNYTEDFKQQASEIKHLEALVPRLESFALGSYGNQTRGVFLCGVDPLLENGMTKLESRLVEGEYFDTNDKAVLIAEGVAEQLQLELGDSVVLISQGYHGVNAAGKYPVKGILHFAPPDLNKRMVYLPLLEAQYFFGANDKISTLALDIDDKANLPGIYASLEASLDIEKMELIHWEALVPGLIDAMNAKLNGVYVFMLILYTIIAFGILGTILMMNKEREYEFGILISIGMKRRLLSTVVYIETIFLGLIGSFIGIAGAAPLVWYFKNNPIDMSQAGEEITKIYADMGVEPIFPAAFEWEVFFQQAFIVFIITLILGLFSIGKIRKLKPVEAMK